MLQLQLIDAVIGADQSAKTRHGTDIAAFDPCRLGCEVDGFAGYQNTDHPPVTGGKIATSRAPTIDASGPTKFWSTAARSRSGSAIASA